MVWWELTCPCKEHISAAHELKLDRHSELQVECQENEWSCYNMAVEVGARGVVADSLIKAAAAIGMRGTQRPSPEKVKKGCEYGGVPLFKMAVLVVR